MEVALPSSPRFYGDYYFSAPSSPSRISQFYKDFDDFLLAGDEGPSLPLSVPFDWEERPGIPKHSLLVDNPENDFAFDISQDWETTSLSAEDLFDGGVIKPFKPPPPAGAASPMRKQRSQTRKMIQGAFSPRQRSGREKAAPPPRGRERGMALSRPPSRRAARSLSPLRDDSNLWGEEAAAPPLNGRNSLDPACSALSAPRKSQKKWSFKDFFLFRSASEGRAADKDPLKKYTASFRRSSFKAIDCPGSRRRGPVSAHELHYTMNRAVSEDLKRKTFLPYKQGILGQLAFNPAVHALANGFGFSRK